MSDKKNVVGKVEDVPVIIGVVGGFDEWASLQPVFDEFANTFDSIPVKVMLAESSGESGEIRFFDNPKSREFVVLPCLKADHASDGMRNIATYLLHNCHFVLLSATLQKTDPIRSMVEKFAINLPANMPTINSDVVSAFEIPQPAPVLLQLNKATLNLEIVGREIKVISADADSKIELGVFEYAEAEPWWKSIPSFFVKDALKKTEATKVFSFLRPTKHEESSETKDEMGSRWLACVKALHRQAEFNKEVWCDSSINHYQSERFGVKSAGELPDQPDSNDFQKLFLIFCKADSLALEYQDSWQKMRLDTLSQIKNGSIGRAFSFLCLGGMAALLFVVSTEFGNLLDGWVNVVASISYAFILGGAYGRFIYARKAAWERKHQDYRFIAEVLAIQLHWMLGGVRKYASSHFPSGADSDIQWVGNAVHTCRFLSTMVDSNQPAFPIDTIKDSWVIYQKNYHLESLQKGREKAQKVLSKRRRFFGETFVALFCVFILFTGYETYALWNGHHGASVEQNVEHAVIHETTAKHESTISTHADVIEHQEIAKSEEHVVGHESEVFKERLETFHHALITLMVFSLVLYALLGEVIEGYGIEQELTRSEALVKNYERCLHEFTEIDERFKLGEISAQKQLLDKQNILKQLGKIAIDAEANWLVVHRERPMQPVKGG